MFIEVKVTDSIDHVVRKAVFNTERIVVVDKGDGCMILSDNTIYKSITPYANIVLTMRMQGNVFQVGDSVLAKELIEVSDVNEP